MNLPHKKPPQEQQLDEEAFHSKLKSVSATIVEKALTLYVILTDKETPAWVRGLILAALAYLINPFDAIPDVLPGIGLTDDLAVLALALERLSHYVTPKVEARVKKLMPKGLKGDNKKSKPETKTSEESQEQKKGKQDNAKKEEGHNRREDSQAPFIERFRIL